MHAITSAEENIPFCVLFIYSNVNIPDDILYTYDWIVLSPQNTHIKAIREKFYMKKRGKLIAYLSVGEKERHEVKNKLEKFVIGENKVWNTYILDIRKKEYRDFLINEAKRLIEKEGFEGLFLDTLDSYKLALKGKDIKEYEESLVRFIKDLRKNFKNITIVINRGFEILHHIKEDIDGIVVESLFKEDKKIRNTLIDLLKDLSKEGKRVIVIEYDISKKGEYIRLINRLGFIPYISDKYLKNFGYSNCTPVPRKIVLLYDSSVFENPAWSWVHRFVQLPLEYLGFIPVLIDVNGRLPEISAEGGYRGVIALYVKNKNKDLNDWLKKAKDKGLKLFFIRELPFKEEDGDISDYFGIRIKSLKKPVLTGKPLIAEGYKVFEIPPASFYTHIIVNSTEGKAILTFPVKGEKHTPLVITEWGGFALGNSLLNEEGLWVFDPFEIFKEVFNPDFPVPDVTTENGKRILTVHIDGDGFYDISKIDPTKTNGEIIRDEILKNYRIPHTVSIIEGEIAPWGLAEDRSKRLEDIARSIFSLKHVEPASHSFSHPFVWNLKTAKYIELKYGYHLPIKGYKLDFKREISGSVSYIRNRLVKDKEVKVFLWSGNTDPTPEILRYAYKNKLFNMNGGGTSITEKNPFLKFISPMGIDLEGFFQVYAPSQNENIYTNLWTDPLWGYINVIQTFELTGRPKRLKPISIYYHFYSGYKHSSLKALKEVYDYALSQDITPLYGSEYIRKVLDFRNTAIIKIKEGFIVKNEGFIRTLRVPKGWGYPDLLRSKGVTGFKEERDFIYIHLDNSGEYRIILSPERPPFWFESSNGKVVGFKRTNKTFTYIFESFLPLKATFISSKCIIRGAGIMREGDRFVLRGGSDAKVEVSCP